MIEIVLRTSLILAAAWMGSRLLRRATAATRHLLWHGALVAVLAAPLLSSVVPKYEISWLTSGARHAPSLGVAFEPTYSVASRALGVILEIASVNKPSAGPASPKLASVNKASEGGTPILQTFWILGSCLLSLWFLTTHVMAALIWRSAGPASPRIHADAERLAADIGVTQRIDLRVGDSVGPFTVGILRACIVLPSSAKSWHPDRLRSVLLHELAHVRRGDCRIQALAQAACALYWFNPLVWVAARALRAERERACDDEVLTHGAQASAYATHLLEIARGLHTRMAAPAVLAMARPREIEGRLVAVLAAGQARVPARATRWVVAGMIAATTMATLGARIGASQLLQPLPAQAVFAVAQPPAAAQPDNTTRALSRALDDPSGQVREKAAIALALENSPDVIPALVKALGDPDPQVREKAAFGLAWRKDERVVEPLIAALGDRDSQVREKAAIALGASGDARAAAPLEAALKDPDDQVREKAVTGLMLLRSGRDPGADGALVRDSLRGILNGLLKLTR